MPAIRYFGKESQAAQPWTYFVSRDGWPLTPDSPTSSSWELVLCEPPCHTQHKYWTCFHHLSTVCIVWRRPVVFFPAPTFRHLWFCPSLSIWIAFVCLCAQSSVHQRKKDTISSDSGFKNIKNFDHYFLWPIGKYLQIIILKKPGMELIHEMPSLGSWVKRVISSRSQVENQGLVITHSLKCKGWEWTL